MLSNIREDLDEKQGVLHQLEQYVDVFLPVKVHSILSETLGACLSRRELAKLEMFEEEKYKSLNDMLLKKKPLTINENMKKISRDLVDFTQKFTMYSKKTSQKQASKRRALKPDKTLTSGATHTISSG